MRTGNADGGGGCGWGRLACKAPEWAWATLLAAVTRPVPDILPGMPCCGEGQEVVGRGDRAVF